MSPHEQSVLLMIWIGYTAVTLVGIIGVLVWAARTRQFRDQDRARYLPLLNDIPAGTRPRTDTEEHRNAAL